MEVYLTFACLLSLQEQARAAGQAAERLKSFAGGLRSAILRDDNAVEDQWAPASRSKHLRSLRAASVPFQSGSPRSFSAGEAGTRASDGSQPLADSRDWAGLRNKHENDTRNKHGADTAALDAEMEAFVDDLLADDMDIMDQNELATSRTMPAHSSAPTSNAQVVQEAVPGAPQVLTMQRMFTSLACNALAHHWSNSQTW